MTKNIVSINQRLLFTGARCCCVQFFWLALLEIHDIHLQSLRLGSYICAHPCSRLAGDVEGKSVAVYIYLSLQRVYLVLV